MPFDASVHGWAWTEATFGWVDPTARAVLALRLLRPDATAIEDGVGMLRDRETVGGGWNYGNRVVLGEDLWPYAQTTAAALVALQGADPALEQRGLSTLRRLWRAERDGGLSVALATAALRLHGDADAVASERAVFDVFERTGFMDDVVTLAWSAIATGPSLARLEVALMATMDRRTFLARSAVAAGAVGAATVVGDRIVRHPQERPWDEAAFAPPGMARVAVLRATSYDAGLEDIVGEGLRAIGADVRGARVVLKPNLVEFDEDTAINTDPRLVAAAVVALRRLGAADVVVGEGPGHRRDTQFVVTSSGLLEALDAVDARFVDLNIDDIARVPLRSRYTALGALWLPRAITDADVVISMPKMKTHHWAGVTLSLKNCFGCVPGRVYGWPKNALHWAGLEQSILDVAAAVRPDYAIVDGIVGMEGNGPISGTPVAANVLVFGDDPVATDVVGARVMGFDPEKVAYLAEAARFLGQGDMDRIRSEGDDVDDVTTDFAVLPRFTSLKA